MSKNRRQRMFGVKTTQYAVEELNEGKKRWELTVFGMYFTPMLQASHTTLYVVSVRPPWRCGAFHDKITVDWSTKFTVRFCGADGGSAGEINKSIQLNIKCQQSWAWKISFHDRVWHSKMMGYVIIIILNWKYSLRSKPNAYFFFS